MKFNVRVYHEDGSPRGEVILNSSVDTVDGKPINSLVMARAYTDRCLVGKNCYAFVDPIGRTR